MTKAVLNGKQIVLIGMMGIASILTYADRTNMGIVIVPMGDENDWSATTRGTVLGSFFIGYICTQIVGGYLSDNLLGGGPVLLIGMSLWSVILLLTPLATRKQGLSGAIAARIALGLAEGVCFPSIHSMIPQIVPAEWLNGVIAFVSCMTYAGGILSLLVSAPIAARVGWPIVFYSAGAIGLVWSAGWAAWIAIYGAELQVSKIKKEKKKDKETKKGGVRHPWKKLVTSSPVWAMFTCNYCNCWGFWLLLTWLPTYFREVFEADLIHLGNLSVLPYAMQGIVGMVLGFLGDFLIRRGYVGKRVLRSGSQAIAMIGAATLLIALLYTQNQIAAVAIITSAMSLNAFSSIGLNVNHFDLAPRHSGFLFGMSNSIGILPGVIGIPLTGWMLEASGYNWNGIFALAATHYVVGLIVFLIFGSFSPIVT